MKEGTFWRGSAILVFAVGGVLITAAAIALCTPWFGFVDLREVVVIGNHHTTAPNLVSLSGVRRGQSLLTLSLGRVTKNLLRHPRIKSVRVGRRLPHTLTIQVQEREEVAWMVDPSGDSCLALGEGGVVLSTDCTPSAAMIELRGARISGSGAGAVLLDSAVGELLHVLHDGVLASLDTQLIDLEDPDSIEVKTESGLRVLLGEMDDVLLRLDSLAALSRSLDVADYEVIDLRFGGEATLVPR